MIGEGLKILSYVGGGFALNQFANGYWRAKDAQEERWKAMELRVTTLEKEQQTVGILQNTMEHIQGAVEELKTQFGKLLERLPMGSPA